MKATMDNNWNTMLVAETDEEERDLLELQNSECQAIFERRVCEALTKLADAQAEVLIRGTGTGHPVGLINATKEK